VHGLFAPAFANRQTLPDHKISALTSVIVRRTIAAAFPQHFAASADMTQRQPSANRKKSKYSQLLMGVGFVTPNSAMLHQYRSKGCNMKISHHHQKGRPTCAKASFSSQDGISGPSGRL
jgi:hypothetical protein